MWQTAAVFAVIAFGATVFFCSQGELKVPNLADTNWGPQKNNKESTEIRPFKIDIPNSVVDDLKIRLANRRTYVEPLEGVAWRYGISTKYLNTILDYWKDKYNWTERQKLLNKYPQFKTSIQGLDIHFYHVRPANLPKDRNIKVLPLMMLHGWPGSTVEFQKIIPILTTPRPNYDFVFELVVPSLPGYGFSDGTVRPGMGAAQIAVILKNLMQRLGYDKFYIQGGDWGALISANLAALYPEKVIGLHSNMCSINDGYSWFWLFVGNYFPSLVIESEHYSKFLPVGDVFRLLMEETGYFHIQATKPDTIGAALTSAPDALAAYILEKFSTWTNRNYKSREDGGLLEKYTLDELLDNLMTYWVTNTITTSSRLYAETMSTKYRDLNIERLPIKVPTGCAIFPMELLAKPKSILQNRYPNIIQFNYMTSGGHFAAFEEPQILADDIFSFVKKREELSEKSS